MFPLKAGLIFRLAILIWSLSSWNILSWASIIFLPKFLSDKAAIIVFRFFCWTLCQKAGNDHLKFFAWPNLNSVYLFNRRLLQSIKLRILRNDIFLKPAVNLSLRFPLNSLFLTDPNSRHSSVTVPGKSWSNCYIKRGRIKFSMF